MSLPNFLGNPETLQNKLVIGVTRRCLLNPVTTGHLYSKNTIAAEGNTPATRRGSQSVLRTSGGKDKVCEGAGTLHT